MKSATRTDTESNNRHIEGNGAVKHWGTLLIVGGLVALLAIDLEARGRGGGGRAGGGGRSIGGGGRSIGGGGMSRPSGGFSRPSGGISRPSGGISRPSSPSFSRPGGGGSRPSIGGGSRPNTGSGSRPNIGGGSRPNIGGGSRPGIGGGNLGGNRPSIGGGNLGGGNRPSIGNGNRPTITPSPGTRPSIPGGSRPGTGNRPGIGNPGNRPGIGDGIGNRPGIGTPGNRPGNLPGIGNGNRPGLGNPGAGIGNRPGIGSRPGTLPGFGNRPSIGDRQTDLQQRIGNRNNINVNVGNRNVYRDQRRNVWQSNHNRFYAHHARWHHGYWPGRRWGAGARWNYWWDNYPVLSAFGVTTWAVNRVGWAFGYNAYVNPYYGTTVVDNSVYNYSQPIVMTPTETTLAADPNAAPQSGVSSQGMADFSRAQREFYAGDYTQALASVNAAVKAMPSDAVVHEFRALTLFALGKYDEAAATLYPVLSVGPGWDWTTLSSLYPGVSTYTDQLRKLEAVARATNDNAAPHFVLAYHYITAGHEDAAKRELERVVAINPKDTLAIDLLQGIDPSANVPTQPEITTPPKTSGTVAAAALVGDWKAKRKTGESFEMLLAKDGTFTWTYTRNGRESVVRGVYALDDDGVLALQMNDDGVMLAQIAVKGNRMQFTMLGDVQGTEPLLFTK